MANETSKAVLPSTNGEPGVDAPLAEPRPSLTAADVVYHALTAIASLRVTVVLFSLSTLLVLIGTLAQVEIGIWTAVEKYFWADYVWVPWRLFYYIPGCKWILPGPDQLTGEFPFVGGRVLGIALLINLLAAHAVRFRLSWKRSGVLVLHVGLIVLIFGEGITRAFQVESTMTIAEGEAVDFLDVNNKFELALTRSADASDDQVVVIPDQKLRRLGRIADDRLPVDVDVVEYHKNSGMEETTEPVLGELIRIPLNPRRHVVIFPRGEEVGVAGQRDDIPTARVRLYRKGTDKLVGEFVVSAWLYPNTLRRQIVVPEQVIQLDQQRYVIELRPKRVYLPYKIKLVDFRHDTYIGTDKPKNFSSRAKLIDAERGDDPRTVVISMNDPLRYRGLTFFQSGFFPDNTGTVLQVVENPARWLPYISCTLVAVGMLVHFSIMLVNWIKLQNIRASSPLVRSSKSRKLVPRAEMQPETRPLSETVVPGVVAVIAGIYFLSLFIAPTVGDDEIDLSAAGYVPCVQGGRVKPLDTQARITMMMLSERQTYVDSSGERQPAMRFLLDLLSMNGEARKQRVFRIENDEVRSALGLEAREGYRYALEEFEPRLSEVSRFVAAARDRGPADQTMFDQKILKFASQVRTYRDVEQLESPFFLITGAQGHDWIPLNMVYREAHLTALSGWINQTRGRGANQLTEEEFREIYASAGYLDFLSSDAYADQVFNFIHNAIETYGDTTLRNLWRALAAYRTERADRFNDSIARYVDAADRANLGETDKIHTEVVLNRVEPFYQMIPFYVAAFLLVCGSWIGWTRVLNRTALWLLIFTFSVHTAAILARMYIQARPPITNLYSTAIFVGWASILIGLILEGVYRNGLGSAVGSVIGFLTLIVAHNLGTDGDTLEMMQAVLDTNFWLATHVTTINLGYAATLLVGCVGIAYIITGLFTPGLTPPNARVFNSVMYGILCFATFASFTGTVLGGIWADQSWGRFWGWDPKENGALMIVIWNALILHARWAGIIKARGMANLALVGNIITAWSWFGTNLLGVGLHAYGFRQGTEFWLVTFWFSQLAFLALGLIPTKYWFSFRQPPMVTPAAVDRIGQA